MLFNQQFASNYEKLITYYPRFYREVLEMDAILRAHGKLADDMESDIEQVFANAFIDTADEETIERLEKFLEIGLYKERSIEERRRLVKSFFVGSGRVSASVLEEMIRTYTGAPVTTRFEPFDDEGNNRLYLDFQRGDEPTLYMSDILLLLSKKIPAHIEYRAELVYRYEVVCSAKRTHYVYEYDLTGTKPDIALIGVIQRVEAVVSEKHQHDRQTYRNPAEADELSGTEPETALIGDYKSYGAAVEARRTHSTADFEQTGTKPDISTLGEIRTATAATEAHREHYLNDLEQSSEEAEAGQEPDETSPADYNRIDAAAGVKITNVSVDYIPCGTIFTES
jgi:hypothetical protein